MSVTKVSQKQKHLVVDISYFGDRGMKSNGWRVSFSSVSAFHTLGEGAVRDDDGSGAVPTPYIGCGLLLVQLFTVSPKPC